MGINLSRGAAELLGSNFGLLRPDVQQAAAADPNFAQKWGAWNRGLSDQFDRASLQGIDLSTGAGVQEAAGTVKSAYGTQWNPLAGGGTAGWAENQMQPLGAGLAADGDDRFIDGWQQQIFGNAVYDPTYGLMVSGKIANPLLKQKGNFFFDKVVPAAVIAGLGYAGGAAAGLWGGAGGAGALAAEGATGLASLPAAGTWVQTALPALGAGAGEWTLPAALSGISGATTTAGGLTLADALTNGFQGIPEAGLTTGGAPVEQLTDNILKTATNGATSAGKTSLLKQLSGVKSLSDVWDVLSNNPMEALNVGSGIAGLIQSFTNKNELKDLADKLAGSGDPFGDQRGQYQKLLSDSYSKPMSIYNSPEYQGLSDMYRKKLEAKDAASGRRSQYAGRELEMQKNFLDYLGAYRKDLAGLAGANINPNMSSYTDAFKASLAEGNDMTSNVLGTLYSLFKSPSISRSSDRSSSNGGGIDP